MDIRPIPTISQSNTKTVSSFAWWPGTSAGPQQNWGLRWLSQCVGHTLFLPKHNLIFGKWGEKVQSSGRNTSWKGWRLVSNCLILLSRITIYDMWHICWFVFHLAVTPVGLVKPCPKAASEVQEAGLKQPAIDPCSAEKLEARSYRTLSLRLLQVSLGCRNICPDASLTTSWGVKTDRQKAFLSCLVPLTHLLAGCKVELPQATLHHDHTGWELPVAFHLHS